MDRNSHIIQQQLETSEKRGNMPQCGYLTHNQKDESKIINQLSPIQQYPLRNQNEVSAGGSGETL